MNKRGQDLSLTTIILIVLGIAVLVFLIWGFATGWGNLWSKVTSYTGGGSNIDTVVQACSLACSGNQKSNFCVTTQTVTYGKTVRAWNGTGMSNVTQSMATCQNLTDGGNYPNVNVAPCPNLC
jgi:hypothetical protein